MAGNSDWKEGGGAVRSFLKGSNKDGRTAADDKEDEAKNTEGLHPSATNPDSVDDAIELGERRGDGDGGAKMGADALYHESHHTMGGADGSTVFYKVYKRRWFGVVQLTLLNIIVSCDWLTFAPVSGDAAVYFGTTESAINWLSIAFFLAFPVASPAVMYALHWGPKPSIMTASALVLLGNWLRYAGTRAGGDSGTFGLVMFGQILTGMAQAFVLAAPTRYSDLWFTNRGRVAATALMSLANPLGAALGQLIVPLMVSDAADIPSMVLYVSIISSVCALPAFFIPAAPPTPASPSAETPKANILDSLRLLARSPEFWMLFIPFAFYVGFFNSISSLLNQIMAPHGYSEDDAGIAGAVLIVVGLVGAAATSPVIDRTKSYILSIKIFVPLITLCYLVFIWMPDTRAGGGVAGPYVILAVLGAASFSLLPVAIELLVEFTHPISPEVTSTLAWSGGQVLGACFTLISDALKAGPEAEPPLHMTNALIFQAALAIAAAVPPLCIGLFGRHDKIGLRRVASDAQAMEAQAAQGAA